MIELRSDASRSLAAAHQGPSIDDVATLALTIWGERYNGYQLRAIAAEMQHNFEEYHAVSETKIIGGLPRTMRVVLELGEAQRLWRLSHGRRSKSCKLRMHLCRREATRTTIRKSASTLGTSLPVGRIWKRLYVGVVHGQPVYLRDVAGQIMDAPADPADYVT